MVSKAVGSPDGHHRGSHGIAPHRNADVVVGRSAGVKIIASGEIRRLAGSGGSGCSYCRRCSGCSGAAAFGPGDTERAAALVVEPLGLVAGPFVAGAVPVVPARAALVVLVVSAVASVVVVMFRHGDTVRAAALAVEPLGLVAGPFVAVAVPGVPARAALLVLLVSVVASCVVAVFGRGEAVRAAAIAAVPLGVVD